MRIIENDVRFLMCIFSDKNLKTIKTIKFPKSLFVNQL